MSDNKKQFKITHEGNLPNGNSYVGIECPFCREHFTASVWSLAGSGKKCPSCEALHYGGRGYTATKHNPIQNPSKPHVDVAREVRKILKQKDIKARVRGVKTAKGSKVYIYLLDKDYDLKCEQNRYLHHALFDYSYHSVNTANHLPKVDKIIIQEG